MAEQRLPICDACGRRMAEADVARGVCACALPTDFTVEGGGTVYLLRPQSDDARAWLAEHCPEDDEHQYFAGALAIGHRFLDNVMERVLDDGLTAVRA